MAQSLAQIYMHLIFSTKNRIPWIGPEVREELRVYMGGILRNLECAPLAINAVADHAHLLYVHNKNLVPTVVVEKVKSGSSKWIKGKGIGLRGF